MRQTLGKCSPELRTASRRDIPIFRGLQTSHSGSDSCHANIAVITNRRVLDQQLQDAIYQVEHAQRVVKAIDEDSRQLAEALIDGTKIVITTLQKFPFVLRGLLHIAGAETQEKATDEERRRAKEWEAAIAARKYAVIVDEAHSSQTGGTARELKAILGKTVVAENGEAEPDWEDGLNQVMQSRGRRPNLSFFAFTATPKGKTLELFGRTGTSGLPKAFHILVRAFPTSQSRAAIETVKSIGVGCSLRRKRVTTTCDSRFIILGG